MKDNEEYIRISSMEKGEAVKELKKLTKRANVRLSALRKNNITMGVIGKTDKMLVDVGRTNMKFYEGTKYETKHDVNKALREVLEFLGAKSSTVGGVHQIMKNRDNFFSKYGITLHGAQKEKFYDFISSETFKQASEDYDSDQLLEMYGDIVTDDASAEKFIEQFETWIESDDPTPINEWQDATKKGIYFK